MWKILASLSAALIVATSVPPAWADAGMRAFVAEVIRQNPTLGARMLRKSGASREVSAAEVKSRRLELELDRPAFGGSMIPRSLGLVACLVWCSFELRRARNQPSAPTPEVAT